MVVVELVSYRAYEQRSSSVTSPSKIKDSDHPCRINATGAPVISTEDLVTDLAPGQLRCGGARQPICENAVGVSCLSTSASISNDSVDVTVTATDKATTIPPAVADITQCFCALGYIANPDLLGCSVNVTTTIPPPIALSRLGRTPTECPPGQFWNTAAFRNAGSCYPCPQGTFRGTTALVVGDGSYQCAGKCPPARTSYPGAISAAECFPTYEDRLHTPGDMYCGGVQKVNLKQCNPFNNKGFRYISTRAECELAAQALKLDPASLVATDVVEDACPDVDTLTGRSSFKRCQAEKSKRGGCPDDAMFEVAAAAPPWLGSGVGSGSSLASRNETTKLKCHRTCTDDEAVAEERAEASGSGSSRGRPTRAAGPFCAPPLRQTETERAPVGYCGIETDTVGIGAAQRLVFYTGAGGDQPARFWTKRTFTTICAVTLCNYLEQIDDDGAAVDIWRNKRLYNVDGPRAEDDAVCVANPKQYRDTWLQAESSTYATFWTLAGTCTAFVGLAAFVWIRRRRGSSGAPQSGSKSGAWAALMSLLNKHQISIASLFVALKVLSVFTDWGFYFIAVKSDRFEYLMEQEGQDHGVFVLVCFVASILGAAVFPVDVTDALKVAATDGGRKKPGGAFGAGSNESSGVYALSLIHI